MSGTNFEKRRLELAGQKALRMAARKFGPEERDLDDDAYMAQIQELQEQLNRLRRQSRERSFIDNHEMTESR
jgi:hypothetical protein